MAAVKSVSKRGIGAAIADSAIGARARASHVRCSAYKAREVLDLIRGVSCSEAIDILAFCERSIATPISKVLKSAIANASYNNGLEQNELYVAACYADEGPTMKRWRPRAQGRATPIRKRTCHITVIVRRYDDEVLQMRQTVRGGSAERSVRSASRDRRRRVALSNRSSSDTQSSGTKSSDTSPSDTMPSDTQSSESIVDGSETDRSETGHTKTGNTKTQESQVREAVSDEQQNAEISVTDGKES